jgi:acetyltransferase-like isoleucine patch superfamily enzyme
MTPPTGQKAKMLAGELYLATDPQLVAEDQRAQELLFRFNIEFALSVVIKDGAWLGGGAIVCPAGGVVTRDLSPGVLAVGNPCRVLRSLDK